MLRLLICMLVFVCVCVCAVEQQAAQDATTIGINSELKTFALLPSLLTHAGERTQSLQFRSLVLSFLESRITLR